MGDAAMKLFLTAVMALIPAAGFAADYSSAVAKPYGEFRDYLFLDGWQPGPLSDADDCSTVKDGRCALYPEAANCLGTGNAMCKMIWSRDGKTLVVYTAGELPVQVLQIGDQ